MTSTTSLVEEIGPTAEADDSRVNLSVRFGAGLCRRIKCAAARAYRSRNSWFCAVLTAALAGGVPSRDLAPVDYLDVATHRRAVKLRLPRDLLARVDELARSSRISRTNLITAIAIAELTKNRALL